MINLFKAITIWFKSFFLSKKKTKDNIQNEVFKNIPYPIKGISDDGKTRVYEFTMSDTWKLLGSLINGDMKLLMHNGKLSCTRSLKPSEWGNKSTLISVINSMQVSLNGQIKKV